MNVHFVVTSTRKVTPTQCVTEIMPSGVRPTNARQLRASQCRPVGLLTVELTVEVDIALWTYVEGREHVVVEDYRSAQLDFRRADVVADVQAMIALRRSERKQVEAINCCDAVKLQHQQRTDTTEEPRHRRRCGRMDTTYNAVTSTTAAPSSVADADRFPSSQCRLASRTTNARLEPNTPSVVRSRRRRRFPIDLY